MLLLKPFKIKGTEREYTDLADQEEISYRGLDHRLSNLRIKYNVELDWRKQYARLKRPHIKNVARKECRMPFCMRLVNHEARRCLIEIATIEPPSRIKIEEDAVAG